MRTSLVCATALGLAVMQSAGQGTLHITFDGEPFQPPGTAYRVLEYYESGVSFGSIAMGGFGRIGANPRAERPDNGTAYLQAAFTESLMLSFMNNSVFDLLSVDLAEYSTVLPNSVTVHFVGYRHDGSIVTTDLTTDGIIDGTGPLPDFQTFNFGPEFIALDRVEIPTSGWSLDNLVVSIPEPGTWTLMLLGGVLGYRFLKRQRKTVRNKQMED